jgi:serine/threonine protein kinase
MGVILYVLLAGFLPFEENTMVALFLKIKNADFTYPSWFTPGRYAIMYSVCSVPQDESYRVAVTFAHHEIQHSYISEHIWFQHQTALTYLPDALFVTWYIYCTVGVRQLLDAVLVSDPTRRLTLSEVKAHPWVVEGPASPGAPTPAASDKVSCVCVHQRS